MKRHTKARIPLIHESASGVPDTCAESARVKVPTVGQSKPITPQKVTAPVIRADTISLGASQAGHVRVAFYDGG
jgi:hypothetical protein